MALVCWSGGLDSTTVLYDLALAYRAAQTDGRGKPPDNYDLRAVSIVCQQVPAQENQTEARERLAHWFTAYKLTFAWQTIKIGSGEPDAFGMITPASGGLPQPLLWLGNAINFLRDDEDLYLGYVRGDDIWHYREPLYTAFAALQKIAGKTGRLLLPLEWDRKSDVLAAARKAGYAELCWYCEASGERKYPCGDCVPCRTHASAVWQLDRPNGMGVPATTCHRKAELVDAEKEPNDGEVEHADGT